MIHKIQITTRADLFEQRKREFQQAGYLIDNEQAFPINGRCSFTAVCTNMTARDWNELSRQCTRADKRYGA
jgi:hypothetical protein